MLKTIFLKTIRSFGYDLVHRSKVRPEDIVPPPPPPKTWIENMGFKTVLDVGANEGQFAKKIRELAPGAFIYSFEPLPEVFEALKAGFEGDTKFKAFPYGLGQQEESIDIYLNDYTPSSSILAMAQKHEENFPETQNKRVVQINLKRLDDLMRSEKTAGPFLLKIDVQGFEENVIAGAPETIAKADVILIELSFVKLYENQPLFHRIYSILYELGFEYHGNFEQLYSPIDNSILQADGIFFRRGLHAG